jgi:TolB protein
MTRLRAFAVAALAVALAAPPAGAVDPKSRRLSVRNNGTAGNKVSDGYIDGLSDDGKVAAFASDSKLVAADGNEHKDIYVRSLRSDKTKWASIEGEDPSNGPAISGNGELAVFWSRADNLIPNDNDGTTDIFVYNVDTRKIQLVSRATNGDLAGDTGDQPAVNRSGRFIAFDTPSQLVNKDNNSVSDIYLRDRRTGKTRLISVDSNGNATTAGRSENPALSATGRFVAFESLSSELVGDDGNPNSDVFIHDRKMGRTRRVSIKSDGSETTQPSELASISADGDLVAFSSHGALVNADMNGVEDVYLRIRHAGKTRLISRDNDGDSAADSDSVYPALSPNGRLIGFYSYATDLIANDPSGDFSAYVFDRRRGKMMLVDRTNSGAPGDMDSYVSGISNRFVLVSTKSALVGSDDNNEYDVYRRGPLY